MKVTVEHEDGEITEIFCDGVLTAAIDGGDAYQCQWHATENMPISHKLAICMVGIRHLFGLVKCTSEEE